MTDTSTILKNTYQGNGSTTEFDYQFKVLEAQELIAIKTNSDGLDEILTLNSDYTIAGIGQNSGGSITYPISGAPLASNQKITLYPVYSLTQTIDFTNQDKAYFELFEEGLDRANLKLKMLKEELNRTIKIGVTSESDPSNYLSDAANYAATASSASTTAVNAAAQAAQSASMINLPESLTGHANKFLQVKTDETGYEFTSSSFVLTDDENIFTANQTINAELDADLIKLQGQDITPYLAQGCCRLEHSSATEVILKGHNGRSLILYNGVDAWVPHLIPTSGITYTIPTSLSANTLYYVYAYDNSGTITLEPSTSAPSIDSATVYMTSPTNDKKLCVGMFYLNGSKQLDNEYMVASYFNRKARTQQKSLSSNTTTFSTSFVEVSTNLRCPFLIWNGDEAIATLNAMQNAGAGGLLGKFYLALDGASSSDRFSEVYEDVNDSYTMPDSVHISENITDASQGYHYGTIAYSTSNASYALTLHGGNGQTSNFNITTLG